MRQIKYAFVRSEMIGWEVYLQPIVKQASGEVKIAFALRPPQLCDELSGPVLGLYTATENTTENVSTLTRCIVNGVSTVANVLV